MSSAWARLRKSDDPLWGRCRKCGRTWDDHNLSTTPPACVPPKLAD